MSRPPSKKKKLKIKRETLKSCTNARPREWKSCGDLVRGLVASLGVTPARAHDDALVRLGRRAPPPPVQRIRMRTCHDTVTTAAAGRRGGQGTATTPRCHGAAAARLDDVSDNYY